MRDGSSLTSTSESYIGFTFDVLLNHHLQYTPVSYVFSKGLENIATISSAFTHDRALGFDEFNSNLLASHLAGMQRTAPWTYFVTFTCNDSHTFGVAPVHKAATEWNLLRKEHDRLMQSLCMIMTRCWHRSVRLFFKCLLKNDKMFGPVMRYVARKEYQSHGSPGNKFHVHCGITLKPGTDDEASTMARIVNRLHDGFTVDLHTDYESLLEDGLVSDDESFFEATKLFTTLQRHSCAPRCKVVSSEGEAPRCRNKRHPPSFEPSFESFPHRYQKSFPIFKHFGLTDEDIYGEKVVEKFCPGIYHPPTQGNSDRVATIPLLQVVMSSQTNVQRCDIRGGTSYTAKYCAKQEERRNVVFTHKDDKTVITEPRDLFNEGITSARLAEEERLKKLKAPEAFAREISLAEMCSFVHNEEYLLTNVEFIKLSTEDLESRVAVLKQKTFSKITDTRGRLTPAIARQNLPAYRRFTPDQICMIRDFDCANYSVDRTSSFSIRPPELMDIKKLEMYVKFFTRTMGQKPVLSEVLTDSHFVDGSCAVVKIRKYYLAELKLFYDETNSEIGREMQSLLNDLIAELDSPNPSAKFKRYVDVTKDLEVSVTFSCISPKHIHKLVYHLVLSMGEFNTELDFAGLNLVQCCEKAKLIPDASNVSDADADALTLKFLTEQMRFLKMTTTEIDSKLPIVFYGIRSLFSNSNSCLGSTPLLSYRAITDSAEALLTKYENDNLKNLLEALNHELPEVSQFRDDLLNRVPVDVPVCITQADSQSDESVVEQNAALNLCKNSIDSYCTIGTTFEKSILLCGPPGAGKTHVFLKAALYCLTKKLRVVITALTSERASKLGGIHLHYLFALPVIQSFSGETTASHANQTLGALGKNKIKFAFLRRLDVIFFEEIGLVSANLLATLDIVLRAVREIDAPMGGVLMICTGDQEQLKPIDGFSMFRSTHLVTMFKVAQLKHMVRARGDPDLRQLIRLLRKHPLSQEEKNEVLAIIERRCSDNFLPDWNHVPEGVLRIVSKKSAVKDAVTNYIRLKVNDRSTKVHIERAEDLIEQGSGNWVSANKDARDKLNYNALEPQELYLFQNSYMKLTYNNSHPTSQLPRFSQGQLCQIEKLPQTNDPKGVVVVRIMPPGVRHIVGSAPPDTWPRAHLTKRPCNPIIVGAGLKKAKRVQYPLCYNVSTTIHKAIGESCSSIATKISLNDKSYALWELQQLLTIVSRVTNLSNIYFVGTLADTKEAVKELLDIEDPSTALQATIVDRVNVFSRSPAIIPATRPLTIQFVDCDVISVNIGFVYLLSSSKDLNVSMIGECSNIRETLKKINTPGATDDFQYAPYALMAYVCGFFGEAGSDENKHWRQEFLGTVKITYYEELPFREKYKNFRLNFEEQVEDKVEFHHLMLKECYTIPD